jgi:hypothetical protein
MVGEGRELGKIAVLDKAESAFFTHNDPAMIK